MYRLCFGFSCLISPIFGQLSPDQIEKLFPSVALVLAGRAPGEATTSIGTAVVVRSNGILLTANHVLKDAYAVQIRFKGGDVFDDVQLLAIDARRDVAAIKISASGLTPTVSAPVSELKAGENITVISHSAALPWSVSTGVVSAIRLADEIPGAGAGYRIIQFTAPASPGSSGGVLLDTHGRALGVIIGSLPGGQNLNFAVPLENVLGLADATAVKTFASGAKLLPPAEMATARRAPPEPPNVSPGAPEKSEILSPSKDRDEILRSFKTVFIDATRAQYFGSDQMKAALGRNKDFEKLGIRMVDDKKVADTILTVGYTFAWDFPFELKYQNTSMVLVAGKGVGPFSGPAGAADVARELVKAIIPYRKEAQRK